eukprot:762431-Hanusia_phi.AAC.2
MSGPDHQALSAEASMQNGGARTNPARVRPKIDDSERIVNILNSMGVYDFDNRVVQMLREILHRFNVDVIREAVWCARHRLGIKADDNTAPVPTVELQDLKLALEMKVQHYQEFAQRPDAEKLEEWAKTKNSIQLPNLPNRPGIPLPMEKYCLNAPNFQIVASYEMDKDKSRRNAQPDAPPLPQAGVAAGPGAKIGKRKRLWNEKSASTLDEWATAGGKAFRFKWL